MDKQLVSSNTNGSNVKILVDSTIYSSGFLLLDSIQHYLYWSDPLKGSIEKYDIIANKRIGLISNYHPIYDKQVAYDGLNEILYILSEGFLVKHNPDGSNADKISANAPSNHTNLNIMCLDVLNKRVYYFDINGKLLYRNYEGSNEQEIVKSPDIGRFSASDLIFDGRNDKFYFRDERKMYSMNTNGSDLKLILNNNNTNIKLVNLDPINNKLYFYDETFVYKMNTDGSGVEPIIKAAITAMTVDPIKERILTAKAI